MLPKKPCLVCGKELECAVDSWDTLQPYGGGEINLIFGYGSCKFDNHIEPTTFRGVICDKCGEKLIRKIE